MLVNNMETHTEKNDRLAGPVCQRLNRRLHEGHNAKTRASWLNGLPEVKSVLDAEFSSRPISPGNLSEWRNGAYRSQADVTVRLNPTQFDPKILDR